MKLEFSLHSFLDNFQAIANCASKDGRRPILDCVNISYANPRNALFIGCNSAVLAKAEVPLGDTTEGWVEGCSVSINAKDTISRLKSIIPSKTYGVFPLWLEYEAGSDWVKFTLQDGSSVSIRVCSEDYPNLDQYAKRELHDDEHITFSISSDLLKRLAATAEKSGGEMVTFTLPNKGGTYRRPIPFEIPHTESLCYGVVTPMVGTY